MGLLRYAGEALGIDPTDNLVNVHLQNGFRWDVNPPRFDLLLGRRDTLSQQYTQAQQGQFFLDYYSVVGVGYTKGVKERLIIVAGFPVERFRVWLQAGSRHWTEPG